MGFFLNYNGMKLFLIFFLLSCQSLLWGADVNLLSETLTNSQSPFNYPMQTSVIPGKNEDADVILLLHGYGGDHSIGEIIHSYGGLKEHLISFNFPDYRIFERGIDPLNSSYGTIHELLPVIYILKKLAVDSKLNKINLYGFSAGCGALVNTLMVLNTHRFDDSLKKVGVEDWDKKAILVAIQNGWVLLDAPFKSINEVFEGHRRKYTKFNNSNNYIKNQLNPIDNLKHLSGLKLNIIIYFEVPDANVGNKLDSVYSTILKETNTKGRTIILRGKSPGGHLDYHKDLWNRFRKETNTLQLESQ